MLRLLQTLTQQQIENEAKDVLAVPSSYIMTDESGENVVYVKNADGSKRDVRVVTGLKTDYYVEVKSDELKEGDTIIGTSSFDFGGDNVTDGGAYLG